MRALLLVCLVTACGGATSSDAPTATPTATVAPTAAPTATATAAASGDDMPDTSPPPFGHRHDKIGNGFFLSGSGKTFYDAIYEPGGHPNILVRQKSNPGGRFVTLMKNVAAAPYAGKKIRVRLQVESKGVTGRGEVWGRAQPPHSPEDAPSVTTKIDADSTDMKVYSVILDVKDDVRVIEYGVSLAGPGEVRVGKDAIDVVP
jgi:hypothetical protein